MCTNNQESITRNIPAQKQTATKKIDIVIKLKGSSLISIKIRTTTT